MNKRLLAYTLLGLLIVSGLAVGLFRDSIQRTLTLSMEMMGQNTNRMQQRTATPTATQQQNMAQLNVLASDTFQRTDQPLWGQSSDGRQWEGDANTKQSFAIVNKTGQIAQGEGGLNVVLGPVGKDLDVTIEGMVNQFGNGVNMGVLLRWTDANNWYKAHIDGAHLTLLRNLNGQSTTLKTVDLQTTANTAYSLRFKALGAMLFAKVWLRGTAEPGNWQLTFSDMALTSGRAGIRVIEHQGAVITILSFKAISATMGGDTI